MQISFSSRSRRSRVIAQIPRVDKTVQRLPEHLPAAAVDILLFSFLGEDLWNVTLDTLNTHSQMRHLERHCGFEMRNYLAHIRYASYISTSLAYLRVAFLNWWGDRPDNRRNTAAK